MQKIIQINLSGRMYPIDEDAYNTLSQYILALERQFSGEEGREIIDDIENRIAELFSIRLAAGAFSIDKSDVNKVIETLGSPLDINNGAYGNTSYSSGSQTTYTSYKDTYAPPRRARLLRDPFNKMVGGVCSGLAYYFDVDEVIVRLVTVLLCFASFGTGFIIYIVAWAIIPSARTRQELEGFDPVSFHDITRNVEAELKDLQRRGEKMSKDLQEFFSRKK